MVERIAFQKLGVLGADIDRQPSTLFRQYAILCKDKIRTNKLSFENFSQVGYAVRTLHLDFGVNQIIGRIEPVCGQWSMHVPWQQMAGLSRSI